MGAAKSVTTTFSLIIGGVNAPQDRGEILGNTGEIFLGNFYSDPERPAGSQVLQLVSRHTWESLQTDLGYNFGQLRNGLGNVDRVDLYRGVTFIQNYDSDNWDRFGARGVSLGNFVNTDQNIPDPGLDLSTNPLFQHEYGHTIDSHIWGPIYLFGIGIPSVGGAQWTEDRADNFWNWYFTRFPF